MNEIRDAIVAEFPRLRAIWPGLNAKPDVLAEVGKAVMKHAERLSPDDVVRGFDDVIQASPTSGWPPGPHEVLGCILSACTERRKNERAAQRREEFHSIAPARDEVIGRACDCGSPLALLREERALWCDTCRRVVRMNLAAWEIEDLRTTRKGHAPGGPELARDALARIRRAPSPASASAGALVDITDEIRNTTTSEGERDEW